MQSLSPFLHDAYETLSQTLEQAIDAVVAIDEGNRIILFNAAAERMWGYAREEVLGRNVSMLVPAGLRAWHDGYVDTNRATGVNKIVGARREVPVARKSGEPCWGAMSISKVTLAGRIIYTAFIRDVTFERRDREQLRLLSLGVNETDNAVIITDGADRIVYVNTGFVRLLGYTSHEVIGRRQADVLPLPSRDEAKESSAARASAGQALWSGRHVEELIHDREGQPLWCSIVVNPITDAAGALVNTVSVITNITDTKMHEVLQHKVLEAMVHEAPVREVMTLVCREVERIAPEVVASILSVDEQGRLRPLAGPSLPDAYSDALDGVPIGPACGSCGTAAYRGEPVLSKDIATDPLWADFRHLALPQGLLACWSSPIKSSSGRVLGSFAFYYRRNRGPSRFHKRLVSVSVHLCALALEREESRSRIRQLAFYDALTGLPNRSLLHARAEQAIADAARSGDALAVLFIDLDRFKQVNDSLGHTAGDELLRQIARRLQDLVAPSDIVGRLAGDEFVVVLIGCDARGAADRAGRIQNALQVPVMLGGVGVVPSASIGISLFPTNGADIDLLLRRADMAMYQAKTAGRHRFAFFSNEITVLAQERIALEAALRDALSHEAIRLCYQPQLRLADGRLHGVEALARWRHPELGEITPARFIPLAEECGLIAELGVRVLREACRQLADWRARGLQVPMVSVNLSPTSFRDADLPSRIAQVLAACALTGSDLTLEITENAFLDAGPETMRVIHEVRALGVRLSVDDFGSGYSSLGLLRRLPVDEIKLDQSFVRDLDGDAASRELTRAVQRIGESLGLGVIAEGVETDDQRRLLQQQGYHAAQGHLFAPALAPDRFEAWLSAHAAGP
ncbi:MAG TPA: EAL domain-containing protein [Dokdonella sp.]|uniref:EAL domain-containing protein n=1 Tax=Dokdonella sp. TaxID=2291710 RepID=UPI002C91C185|nr:EAL domain-containing protein [Dokdonella sp.]HUD42135.1 EAL domain-containing protein [Dokdonella sp.]